MSLTIQRPVRETFSVEVASINEMQKLIESLGARLKPGTIVLLQGQMGAGKTQSVKWICNTSDSASPSYGLHHTYQNGQRIFDHFDLDRLESQDDLESSGFWDVFQNKDHIVLIEWPERLRVSELPIDWDIVHVQITRATAASTTMATEVDSQARHLSIQFYSGC